MLDRDMLPRRFSAALFLAVALFVPVAATQPLVARADCVTSNGATLCSDGEARGPSNNRGPSVRGPYVPYPCYDLYCGGGLAIALRD
jgi:hypothetical protein